MTSQYAAFGKFKLAYEEFGTDAYLFEGSLWKTPLELDALNVPWLDPEEAVRRGIVGESYGLYLFHMTFGHHGFWSLTPIFLFSAAGMVGLLRGAGKLAAALAVLIALAVVWASGASTSIRPSLWSTGGSLHPYLWVGWVIAGLTVASRLGDLAERDQATAASRWRPSPG